MNEIVNFSVFETAFTTEEAAQILNIEIDELQSVSHLGYLRRSIHAGGRLETPFLFHNYFDILEYRLRRTSNECEPAPEYAEDAICEFLDDWTNLLDQCASFSFSCATVRDAAIEQFLHPIKFVCLDDFNNYGEFLVCNSDYEIPKNPSDLDGCALGVIVLKRSLSLLRS